MRKRKPTRHVPELTRETLRKHFTYSPESGKFHRILLLDAWGNETPIFKEAGTIHENGYVFVQVFSQTMKAHRLAFLYMTGEHPEFVDHINGGRSDNRWINLRDVSRNENAKNRCIGSNNTSGALGVTWFSQTRQWRARINVNGVRYSLGLFDTFDDAVTARTGAQKLLGYHDNHGRRSE